MARKTQENQEEWRVGKERAWAELRPKLEAVQQYHEAKLIAVRDMPRPDTPGRLLYTNLKFFLATFDPPGEASRDELGVYLRMLERIDKTGVVMPGVAQSKTAALRAAMENRLT